MEHSTIEKFKRFKINRKSRWFPLHFIGWFSICEIGRINLAQKIILAGSLSEYISCLCERARVSSFTCFFSLFSFNIHIFFKTYHRFVEHNEIVLNTPSVPHRLCDLNCKKQKRKISRKKLCSRRSHQTQWTFIYATMNIFSPRVFQQQIKEWKKGQQQNTRKILWRVKTNIRFYSRHLIFIGSVQKQQL